MQSIITHCVHARVRTSSIINTALVHILATVFICSQPRAREFITRTLVTAPRVGTRILARSMAIPQQTLIDICYIAQTEHARTQRAVMAAAKWVPVDLGGGGLSQAVGERCVICK